MYGGAFDVELAEQRDGLIIFRVDGAAARDVFKNEAGGHRFQRIPPTEKRGRVQTSTITIAVMPEPTPAEMPELRESELEITTCRGTGSGGQKRNVTDSAVQVKHLPTGLYVRSDSERSQTQNKATAKALLRARLYAQVQAGAQASEAAARRQQIGSGMRGDKVRSIRIQDGQVHDHRTGCRWRFKDYERGIWD